MKCFFQYLGLLIFIFFSFYYTEKVALLVQSKNPLIEKINKVKDVYEIKSVDSLISDSTIIPGINGLKVNVIKSFKNMKNLENFNETYLIFDEIKPKVSLSDNIDKIIVSGNIKNKQVAIIINNNEEVTNYFMTENIKASLISKIDHELYASSFEYINGEVNEKDYNNLETLLNRKKINKNICIIENNIDLCKKHNKYLVMPYLTLSSNNIIDIKNNLKNGSIVLIKPSAKLSEVKLVLKQIMYNDLNIVHLSKLISEARL